MIGYDEGYLANDKALAGAVWRHLLGKHAEVEPVVMYELVHYIHKNLRHLETVSDQQLLEGYVTFIGLHSEKPNNIKDEEVLKKIQGV